MTARVKSELAPIVGRLRGYHSLMRGGHPSICDDAADTISDLLEALQEVLRYRRGEGEYRFVSLPADERENAMFDAWQEVETRVCAAIARAKGAA